MKTEDIITIFIPSFVGILYFITGCAYLYKKEYAWAIIWVGYSISNFGLVFVGNQH